MKLLLDMNLPPSLVIALNDAGHDAVHWSQTCAMGATDQQIMSAAMEMGQTVVTHDLDFSAILAASGATGPSVIQVRLADVLAGNLAPVLLASLEQFETALLRGAIVVVDPGGARARVLPLR